MRISSQFSALAVLALGIPAVHAGVDFSQGGMTVTNQGQQTSFAGATTVDFNDRAITNSSTSYTSGLLTLTGVTGGSPTSSGTFVSGSTGNYAAPAGDNSIYLAIGGTGRPGPITATFSTGVSYLGFSWTTPDTFNNVKLYNGSTLLGSFTPGTNTPGLTVASTTGYANFNTNSGDVITSAVFSSPSAAFETDNFAYALVPEPSTFGLLGGAALLLGVYTLRKRSQVA